MLKENLLGKEREEAVILRPVKKTVRNWLFLGLVLIFFQVVIGGITRLTDSGLSITEWAIIQGTIPPLNEVEWNEAFEKYKLAARKQFESLHADMTLGEFKVIFFWEYFHRLWARMMGFIFVIPLLFFLKKKWIPGWLGRRLFVVFLLAAAAATFGWVMVDSGLNDDQRTWVSAYKLIVHLGIATSLFAYLFWTFLKANQSTPILEPNNKLRRLGLVVISFLLVQILLGGMMAGMKAGLVHPHFPFFIEGDKFLLGLKGNDTGLMASFLNYEVSVFVKNWVQLLHRLGAYIITFLVLFFIFRLSKVQGGEKLIFSKIFAVFLLFLQFLLGVLTIVNSIGKIPVYLGVAHQGVALLLLISILSLQYQLIYTRNV